ncbi:hypothetical protein C0Q70_01737 [Pomacea canaliculata]|uniref:Uncharacterized protein n=1 Tax=Pomacea canaliculata TaxID=400727 RepID=A0A2T7Q0B6_POMCA|nr:hypothetical protein C0Q70_01737 [Pomacea canaliculata]
MTDSGRKSQAASTAGRVLGSSSTPGARDIDHEAEMEGGGGDEGKDNKNAKDRSSQVVWGGGSGCRLALASDERQQTVVKDPTHGWTIARGRVAQNNRYYAALCRVVDLIQTETGAGSVRVRVGQTGRMDWPPMAATGVTALGSGVVCSEIKGGGGRKTRPLSVSHAEPCLPPFGCEGKRTGTALGEFCFGRSRSKRMNGERSWFSCDHALDKRRYEDPKHFAWLRTDDSTWPGVRKVRRKQVWGMTRGRGITAKGGGGYMKASVTQARFLPLTRSTMGKSPGMNHVACARDTMQAGLSPRGPLAPQKNCMG